MSACISRHGEFGSHECSVDFVCDYCGVLDEEGLFAALNEARAKVARVEALHRPDGGVGGPGAICVACTDNFGTLDEDAISWPCATARALDGDR